MLSFKSFLHYHDTTGFLPIVETLSMTQIDTIAQKVKKAYPRSPIVPERGYVSDKAKEMTQGIFPEGKDHVILHSPDDDFRQEVEEHLKEHHGASIHNWKSGLALDKHGRTPKISKLLSKSSPELLKRFASSTRSNKRHVMIITRDAFDGVAAGSTKQKTDKGKKWSSCMSLTPSGNPTRFGQGVAAKAIPDDIEGGTIAAYKVPLEDGEDPHQIPHNQLIGRAVGRGFLKVHTSEDVDPETGKSHSVYIPENKWYSNPINKGDKTGPKDHQALQMMKDWAEKHTPMKPGRFYKKDRKVYDDDGTRYRKKFNIKHLDQILNSDEYKNNPNFRKTVAINDDLTPEHLDKILNHPKYTYPDELLNHPNLTSKHIDQILNEHKNEAERIRAKLGPDKKAEAESIIGTLKEEHIKKLQTLALRNDLKEHHVTSLLHDHDIENHPSLFDRLMINYGHHLTEHHIDRSIDLLHHYLNGDKHSDDMKSELAKKTASRITSSKELNSGHVHRMFNEIDHGDTHYHMLNSMNGNREELLPEELIKDVMNKTDNSSVREISKSILGQRHLSNMFNYKQELYHLKSSKDIDNFIDQALVHGSKYHKLVFGDIMRNTHTTPEQVHRVAMNTNVPDHHHSILHDAEYYPKKISNETIEGIRDRWHPSGELHKKYYSSYNSNYIYDSANELLKKRQEAKG